MNTKQKLHQLHLNEWESHFAEHKYHKKTPSFRMFLQSILPDFIVQNRVFQSSLHSFRRLQYCVSAVFKALHGIFLSLFIYDLRLLISSPTPFQT